MVTETEINFPFSALFRQRTQVKWKLETRSVIQKPLFLRARALSLAFFRRLHSAVAKTILQEGGVSTRSVRPTRAVRCTKKKLLRQGEFQNNSLQAIISFANHEPKNTRAKSQIMIALAIPPFSFLRFVREWTRGE